MLTKLLSRQTLGYALIFLLTIGFTKVAGDTLWSIRLGEDLLAGENIWRERYSWTAAGEWYPNHEWLFELLIYGLYRLGGGSFALFYLAQGLIAMAAFALLRPSKKFLERFSLSENFLTAIHFFALPGFVGTYMLFWEVRAQTFTFLFTAVLVYLLRTERYRWIPLLFVPWVNMHGGFIVGCYLLFASFLLALGVHWKHRTGESAARVKSLLLAGAGSFVATFLSPLHYHNWSYIFERAGDSGQQIVLEFSPTFSARFPAILFGVLALIYLLGLLVLLAKKREWLASWEAKLALFLPLAVLPLAAYVVRFLFTFYTVAIPLLLLIGFAATGNRIFSSDWLNRLAERVAVAIAGSARLWVGGLLLLSLPLTVGLVERGLAGDDSKAPSADLLKLLDRCPGYSYNTYNTGAALIFYKPDFKIYSDNRYDPYPEIVREHFLLKKDSSWDAHLKEANVSCVLVDNIEKVGAGEQYVELLTENGYRQLYKDDRYGLYRSPHYDPSQPTSLKKD